jgi:hypothetical protein
MQFGVIYLKTCSSTQPYVAFWTRDKKFLSQGSVLVNEVQLQSITNLNKPPHSWMQWKKPGINMLQNNFEPRRCSLTNSCSPGICMVHECQNTCTLWPQGLLFQYISSAICSVQCHNPTPTALPTYVHKMNAPTSHPWFLALCCPASCLSSSVRLRLQVHIPSPYKTMYFLPLALCKA